MKAHPGSHRRAEPCETRAKVVHVGPAAQIEPLDVEARYQQVLMIVHGAEAVLGQFFLPVPVDGRLTAEEQRSAVVRELGEAIWRDRLTEALEQAAVAGDGADDPPAPNVSVVVCTRDRPEQLRRCLEALLALRTPPDEILVVDNAPSDDRTARLCGALPVSYVVEPAPGQARARNRGIVESSGAVVAFTDDDCVPDPGWLDDLGSSFSDPLVMVVTGYIGPVELEHPAQYVFESHYGFGRSSRRRVLEGMRIGPVVGAAVAGAGANMIVRREAFSRVGLFAEEFGPGTPARSGDDKHYFFRTLAAGFRILQEPRRKVWHRHRADLSGLARIMNEYGTAEFAFATRCLLRHRELSALRVYWWWTRGFLRDTFALLRRDPDRLPARLVLAEIGGAALGPWRLLRSGWSRRGIPPIRLPGPEARPEPPGSGPARGPGVEELPRLSVTIATHERREELRRVLEQLALQEYPHERFEVVLVVDGSTDGTSEMARGLELPYELRVLEQENRGTAAARNRGVAEARSPLVVFLDDDIRPVPAFLAAHARAHADGDRRRVALGYCPPVEPTTFWETTLRAWWEDHYRLKAQRGHQWTFIDCSEGNASLTRELFLSVGGYDETFDGKNRHDWDLGYRLLGAGARLGFQPEARGRHHYRPSFAGALRNQRECGRLDVLLARKHPGLIGQLPLARVARLVEWKPSVLRGAHRRTSRFLLASGIKRPLLATYESLRLRRRWQSLANDLLVRAYLLGVLDAVPSREEVLVFLGPILRGEETTVVPLRLAGGPVRVPPAAGRVELGVGLHGAGLATVTALEGGDHWDWEAITRRIVDEVGGSLRLELALDALERTEAARLDVL